MLGCSFAELLWCVVLDLYIHSSLQKLQLMLHKCRLCQTQRQILLQYVQRQCSFTDEMNGSVAHSATEPKSATRLFRSSTNNHERVQLRTVHVIRLIRQLIPVDRNAGEHLLLILKVNLVVELVLLFLVELLS